VVVSQLDATHISERIEHHAYGRNFVLGESHLHSPAPQSVLTSVSRTSGDDNAARE
jgi:hypothetical protein